MKLIKSFFRILITDPMSLILRIMAKPWFPITDALYLKIWYKHATGGVF